MSETLELTTKPSANLDKVMVAKMDEFLAVAAPNVRADTNWLARAKLEILSKPETAALMTKTRGIETALYAIMRAATVGINFGGTKPQAYFVPAGEGVRLDVSQYGYLHAAVYGPGAVLSVTPELIKVYENDGTRMDQATGEIIFPKDGIDPFKDRGALVGYLMRLEFKDGRQPVVTSVTQSKVKEIAEKYGQMAGPAYKRSPEEMYEKIAVKQLLKRAYAESEGNAQNALDYLDEEPPTAETIERDPAARMGARLDQAAESMKMAERDPDPEVEEEPTEAEVEAKEAHEAAKEKEKQEVLF